MQILYIATSFLAVASLHVRALGIPRDILAYSSGNSSITALSSADISSSTAGNNTGSGAPFWLEHIKHQGTAAFNKNSTYQVFRNVKDFGAKGDGVSDDTQALNLAISSGDRCIPGYCEESTTSPALIYIPGGTYLLSAPIIDYYYTQIVGNPNDMPILKATEAFKGLALIDGDPYQPGSATHPAGSLSYNPTNLFYRQIRNMVLDTTEVPAKSNIRAIHWPTAQATSLKNLQIKMNDQAGTQHQGLFIESGSGGFMSDIEFYGGLTGASLGNQQFTARNLWFYNAVQAVEQVWDWGWTYKSIHVTNCSLGLNMTNVNPAAQNVGSIVLIDSFFADTSVGISTSHDSNHWKVSNGSLILENVGFQNVQLAVQGTQNWTALPTNSGNLHVDAWGIGHEYAEQGPQDFLGTLPAVSRVASLTAGSNNRTYYERSKPDYSDVPVNNFISVKAKGARGDGVTDDTDALQEVLDQAGTSGQVVFFDAGTYKVTKTLHFPKTCKIVGESYATIMSGGTFFADMNNPRPVVQVGKPDDVGSVEWSDMIVSTQGAQAGAILIEWNVAATGTPSGMWDVHTRIGGFTGSKLGLAECPATNGGFVGTKVSNSTINRRTTGTKPQFNVGFPVYEGVVGAPSAGSSPPAGSAPPADSAPTTGSASQMALPSPASTPSNSSTLPLSSSPPLSSPPLNSLPFVNSFPSPSSFLPPSLPPSTILPPLASSTVPPILPPSTISPSMASFSPTMSLPAMNSSSVSAIPPPSTNSSSSTSLPTLTSSSSSASLLSLTSSIPYTSSSLAVAAPYNLTTQATASPLASNDSFTNVPSSNSSNINPACVGAFMSMHITNSASGLYMENVWLWTADHDLDASFTNITVYSGRGLLVESQKGNIWMVGTSSEHHSLYQYQLAHTQNIFLGQMQSETAYYQPQPAGGTPFPPFGNLNDPLASELCRNGNGSCEGFGLRILDSQHVAIYGAGLYSFFDDYNDSCSFHANGESCQRSILSIAGSTSTDITIYDLNTVGAASMVDKDGTSLAKYSDNVDVFPDTIALFRVW